MKKGVLKNFAKFSGKHLCQGIFFNVAGLKHFFYRTPSMVASGFSKKLSWQAGEYKKQD